MSSTEESTGRYEDVLTTHNYDGIQEYDNPMPSWWTWIFVATVVWAAVYFVGINIDLIPDYQDTLAAEMERASALKAAVAKDVPPVTQEMLAEAAASEAVVAKGAEVYTMNCAACHGNKGQGLIGPNLTDNAWLYGGSLTDIHTTVEKGKPDKGMPAWGEVLLQEDQVAVTAYVDSIRGTNPPDPKPPEGEPYEPAAGGDDQPEDEPGAPADEPSADEAPAEDAPAEDPADAVGADEAAVDQAPAEAKGS